jgi:hypothetical protein
MFNITNKNLSFEIVFLISHPSDLNLTLQILKYAKIDNFLILIQNNRFLPKIKNYLDNQSITKYKVLRNNIRYGQRNIFKNLWNIFELKYFLFQFRDSKLIIFDKSQLISNVALRSLKEHLIISSYSKNAKLKNINIRLSLVTLFYSVILFFRPVLAYKTLKEVNTKTQPYPDYSKLLYWNALDGLIPLDKKISFPTKKIAINNEVIIFGSRFTEWQIKNRDQRINEIHNFYKNLYRNFPTSSYVYCPHPRESKKEFDILKSIFEENLKLESGFVTAEDLLSKKDANKFCISITSTASKSAYMLGFKSYVFTLKINFEKEIHQIHQSIFSDVNKEIFNPPQTENDLTKYSHYSRSGYLKNLDSFLKN